MSIVEGYPWCMFASPRAWDPERCEEVLATVEPTDFAAVEAALIATFGTWVLGRDSVPGRHGVTEELGLWHELLERIEGAFAEVSAAAHGDTADELAHAVMALIPIVVELTDLYEQWFNDLEPLLQWYCDRAAIASADISAVIHGAVTGSFNSWVLPPDGGTSASVRIGQAIAAIAQPLDALAAWTASRHWPAHGGPPLEPGTRPITDDPHARYIEAVDRPRGAERADALRIALDACRAAAGELLTVDRLASWQQIVLDVPAVPELRTTDAFAKGGRERYPIVPDLRERLASAMRDAEDPQTSLIVRAVRLYLDICYLHPFTDGNARAARLALDHLLTRHRYGLHAIAPLIGVAWQANAHPLVYASRVLGVLVGPCPWH